MKPSLILKTDRGLWEPQFRYLYKSIFLNGCLVRCVLSVVHCWLTLASVASCSVVHARLLPPRDWRGRINTVSSNSNENKSRYVHCAMQNSKWFDVDWTFMVMQNTFTCLCGFAEHIKYVCNCATLNKSFQYFLIIHRYWTHWTFPFS